MKKFYALLVALMCVSYSYARQDFVKLVNTLQGTHNTPEFSHGRCTPVTALPHGMNQWSPGGFNYVQRKVSGITGSGFSLIPMTSKESVVDRKFSASFAPEDINGKPHLFKVTDSNGITSEVTPTERGAILKFSYPKSAEGYLVFSATDEVNDIVIDPENQRISGYVSSLLYHENEWYKTYFILEFDQPFKSYGTAADGKLSEGQPAASGRGVSAYVSFRKGAKVQVKAASSRISAAQAAVTFGREVAPYSFDDVKKASFEAWNDLLNRIVVEGGTEEQRKTFYSCLYRANLRPARNYEIDADGKEHFYLKGAVHEGKYHTSPILWDAFRSLFALQNIIDTDEQKEYVQSLQKMKPIVGWWPSGHVMIGNHAISVFAEAWAKGVRTFDPDTVLKYYHHEVTHSNPDLVNTYNLEHQRGDGRMGFEDYFSLGYIPYGKDSKKVEETTARTLEYTYDDFCAYQLAKMTGNEFYQDVFGRQMFNYKNVFDPSDRFMKGRDKEGDFDRNFNPYEWGGAFVEGNGWQWKWSVFHDVQGYIDLMGGEKQFTEDLDALFKAPADSVLCGGYGFMIHEINEAVANGIGQYPPGNEPSFHIPYLYNYAGAPWKCQEIIRTSLQKDFTSEPDGFPGDEDGGAMSSFYVLSALGFYSVTPGIAEYTIGSPLFSSATITLENGNKFIINAVGNSPDNIYIQSATLDGQPYSRNFLKHEDIMDGGVLEFRMGSVPNMQRGTAEEDKPFSVSR